MAVVAHDIKLNGKGYRLTSPGGWKFSESPKSLPGAGRASSEEFSDADDWSRWGQSDWQGEGQDDWLGDGPYLEGYGLDLDQTGAINVAKALTQARSASSTGWVMFPVAQTCLVCIGKTTSTMEKKAAGGGWSSTSNIPASGVKPTSWGILKGVYYVGGDNGRIYSTTDGTTFTDKGTQGPTTPSYILGAVKGKLYVGSANKLLTYDGTTWAEVFATLIDGTPVIGARGSGGLYFITQGPYSVIYWTDGNQLHQMAAFGSDFMPKDCAFKNRLHIVGSTNSETNTLGSWWALSQNQLDLLYDFGDGTKDYGIRSLLDDGNKLYWGANNMTGAGVFDETLDLYEDFQGGFYVGSTIDSITTGVVDGMAQFEGIVYVGIQGQGIYGQATPGTYRVRSSLFSGQSKNVNKAWGIAEVRHSSLVSGQTCVVKTLKDGVTLDTWGTSSTVGTVNKIIDAPTTPYKSPVLQYELSGTANGSVMSINSIQFSFIEASDNPKRRWILTIQLEGSADDQMQYQDGTDIGRSSVAMKAELDALWNTITSFEDIDGTTYSKVIVKFPAARADEIIKDADSAGTLTEVVMPYQIHLTQL